MAGAGAGHDFAAAAADDDLTDAELNSCHIWNLFDLRSCITKLEQLKVLMR